MKNLWIVTKNELKRYFISPLAYVYLISFLVLNGSFAVYFGHFFERGRADLLPMFGFQPWLYLLFIPGISMRLWAEEFRSKTIVQIMTMPVSAAALVWGKFFASWLFCALALILTFPFWLTVNLLGQPDNAVIALSYAGSFLLAGCMLAVSQTMSALTKNQVIALVLAVITNLVFFLSSLEYVLSFFRLFMPLSIVDLVASFSFITHFDTISRGLLELRDLVFFASLILLFNFTSEIIVSFKTSGTSRLLQSSSRRRCIAAFIVLLLGFIGLNLLANSFLRNIQYDVTEEKIFSLSPATRTILKNLPQPVTAKLYYSKILGQRNPEFRLYFDKLRLLMEQYSKISDGRFDYRIFYPEPLSREEDYALSMGLQPLPVIDKSQAAFFGMILNDSIDNRQIIPFFTLDRQDFIEQDLTEAVYLLNGTKGKLGLISSLPLNSKTIENVITPRWEIMNQLDKFYNTTEITQPEQLQKENFDVLMIVHPTDLSPEFAQAIIDYSYKGGKILLFVDIAAEAVRNFAPSAIRFKASNLRGLDKAWGFRYYPQAVVADLENSLTVDASSDYSKNTNFTQDVIQFLLKEKNFNPVDPSTRNLRKILFSSATVIEPDLAQEDKVRFMPLITAGFNSSVMNAELVRDNVNPADILRNFKADKFHKIVAARLTGKEADKAFDVIVIGDTDMLYDNAWGHPLNLAGKDYFIPILDNANFVLNALETLEGKNILSSLRGRSGRIRAFDNVEQIRKTGLRNFKIKEKEILDNIETAKAGIQEIWNKKTFEQRTNFTPDELALIAGIRKKLDSLRDELRSVRAATDTEIRRIDTIVKFVNIYSVPLLIIFGLSIFVIIRRRPAPRETNRREPVSRPLAWVALGSLALLFAGLLSVGYTAKTNSGEFLDRPVFPNLAQKINQVETIALSGHRQKLEFYKENGIWKLKGHNLPVLQDRIRSFLSAMLEAVYFEKKSGQAQYLSRFGLQPTDQPDAPGIWITLQNAAGDNIENFEVGHYDIEIGRGTRAAYIRFAGQFQVWQIAADFIDLSVNPDDWTYSTLWNLRLGRFISFNNQNNPYAVADLARKMLNSKILSVSAEQPSKEPAFTFRLLTEGNNEITVSGWQDKSRSYISYDFKHIPNENRLQLFEKYTKGKFCEISATDMENLKNVLKYSD